MRGVHNQTGKALEGLDHLRQSIRDILTTPLGTRVMRRDYGSRLFELIDAPTNRETIMEIIAATAEALMRWEPRLAVERVVVDALEAGKVTLTLFAEYLPTGEKIRLDGIVA